MPSSELVVIRLPRSSRWNVLAKRWASSRIRWSMNSASLPRGTLTGSPLPGHVDLLEPLGQRGDRDLLGQAELVDHPLGHGELPLAAVDEQQLRWVLEPLRPGAHALLQLVVEWAVALAEVRRQSAGEHLLHRRVVVVAGHVLDLEAAVLALVRQPVLEHDHRPDVVGALEVGHVVALDAQRGLGQVEQVLQLGERPAAGVVVAGAAQPVADELLLGVARHRLVQRPLVAALGHAHLHPRAAQVGQPLLVGGDVVATPRGRAPAWARRAAARRRTAPP